MDHLRAANITRSPWPIDRHILFVVGGFIAVVALLLYISFTGLEVLSWARSYLAGEGSWARAQKDAVIALHRYARSRDPADSAAYRRAIAIPLANRRAREQLERPNADMEAAHEALVAGGSDPDDVAGFSAAIRAFAGVEHINRARDVWRQADRLVERLVARAGYLERQIGSGTPDPAAVDSTLRAIDVLNDQLTRLEAEFSSTLGDGTRWLKRLIMTVLLLTTLLLALGAVGWSAVMSRRIRETQLALGRSEEQYRSLVDRATYGIYRSSVAGRFVAVNPALVEMLGYQREEDVLGLSLEHDLYLYPDDRKRLIGQYRETKQIEDVEVEWRRRDGTPITVRLNGRPVHEDGGALAGFEMIVENVTDRKVLEEQLRQSQKMEAVGRLTGGIAHDLNNLLTVILANADLLTASTSRNAEAESELHELRQAARRGAAMIRKLLAFSRQGKLTRAPIDVASVVREASGVLRRLLPESIEIAVSVEESLPPVQADGGAIEQMLVNLATNARDAMPAGGRLRIEVLRGHIDERFATRRGWGRSGDYICVRVTDTGTGMDTETRRRIFEPFFTTKAPGSGTGLGMAMIYGLVKQHEGYIDVESWLGRGTCVTLYFPIGACAVSETARQPLLGALPRGHETVLVVEDEMAIRSAVKRGLERLGYRVLLASDGEEGLEIFRLHAGEIDLVLTDVVMPRMTGTQLYRALRAERSGAKVLFMSGYTERDGLDSSELDPALPLLRKPWTLDQLADRVRELLDERSAVPVTT